MESAAERAGSLLITWYVTGRLGKHLLGIALRAKSAMLTDPVTLVGRDEGRRIVERRPH